MTVYHARRPMPRLLPANEAIHLVVPTSETRFMVLAPGGENPRPELDPKSHKVGIRIQKKNRSRPEIMAFRDRLLAYETPSVLGNRRPSTLTRNAFGSRNFQLHMAMLRSGSRIERDLTKAGRAFRRAIDCLTFDRFIIIDVIRRTVSRTTRGDSTLAHGGD